MNANIECIKELSFLPPIKNAQEKDYFKQGLLRGQKGSTWLAFNDRLSESMYMSVDGSQIEYMDWASDYPKGKGSNCVAFNNEAKYGTMADYPCTKTYTYVCKKPLEGKTHTFWENDADKLVSTVSLKDAPTKNRR